MSDHQALYEAMREAAADSENAAIRARKTIGFASGGLTLMLAIAFLLLNVGPRLMKTSVPAAQAASHPQAPAAAPIAAVDPKVAGARKVPAATSGHRVANAKHHRYHHIDDEESATN
jgi:hypothetical protein